MPTKMQLLKLENNLSVADLSLLPKIGWDKKMHEHWDISEEGAKDRLDEFVFKEKSIRRTLSRIVTSRKLSL